MMAAHHFYPVEDQDFEDLDVEVMNRPLNEVHLAFEVLLEVPAAVPVAAAEAANPPAVVAAEAANLAAVVAAEVVNLAAVVAANPAAVVATNPEVVVAVQNPPAVPAIRGRRRGRPPLNRGAPRNEGNRVENPDPIPPAVSDSSSDGDVGNRFQRFFVVQEANFMNR